ncbi:MAG: polyphosphate glucokinase [Neolewinella sp.]|jgi:polyphosphate glucokinase
MKDNVILGIDVGATGIKGGLVDVRYGTMLTERHRFDTPHPATPKAVAETVKKLVDYFEYEGPVGVGFPAIVRRGVAASASNIDKTWIGTSITKTFERKTGNPFFALNDADAAGVACMKFGVGQKYAKEGTVLMVTIGTGLGGALFVNGELMPNLEIGQVYLKDMKIVAERYISNKIRKDNKMDWKEFGEKFNHFIAHVDFVLNPDLIILGGGASKSFPKFSDKLNAHADITAAEMQNTAGTIGAAVYAWENARK